jgi:hypothetical protein
MEGELAHERARSFFTSMQSQQFGSNERQFDNFTELYSEQIVILSKTDHSTVAKGFGPWYPLKHGNTSFLYTKRNWIVF